MADDRFQLRIITPERVFYEGEATMIELTTTEGEIGIYKNHVPLTYIIAPGILRIMETGETKEAALHSGFIEILQEKITILAEAIEWPDEIDVNRAQEAKIRAERRLNDKAGDINLLRAETALQRALARIQVAKKINSYI